MVQEINEGDGPDSFCEQCSQLCCGILNGIEVLGVYQML